MYEIKNIKGHRKYNNKYIILCQAKNLFPTKLPLNPSITRGNRKYTWGEWQRYFMSDSFQFRNPCHYFVEFLDNDYVIYSGLGLNERSYFLEDLADNGVIDRQYRDATLIVIQEDFETDKIEDRLYAHLCSKIICPMMVEYGIPRSNIAYIDEILNIGWEINQLNSNLDYGITEANYFNPVQLTQFINKYRKMM